MISKVPVRFICVDSDGEEIIESEIDVLCMSIPRIGETVQPVIGSSKIVIDVVHGCFSDIDIAPYHCAASITVVLREAPEESKIGRQQKVPNR